MSAERQLREQGDGHNAADEQERHRDAADEQTSRLQADFAALASEVAELWRDVDALRPKGFGSGSSDSWRIDGHTVREHIRMIWRQLGPADGVDRDYGVYGALSLVHRRLDQVRVDVLDRAHRIVREELTPVWAKLTQLRKDQQADREHLRRIEDSLLRNLRAERVRADGELLRENDFVHHELARELAALATKARHLAATTTPADPSADSDAERTSAQVVRRVLEACLSGSMVDEEGVRAALYGEAGASPEPADRSRLRRFLDFASPVADGEYDVWHPCLKSAPPAFVVVPAYCVAGRTFSKPVVFTESPPAAASDGADADGSDGSPAGDGADG